MQRPGGAVSSGPKLSNGCQPFGPVSTNYSSISGERQTASGKATRGMSWIIITRPDLANITFLSADCKQAATQVTGMWGATPGDNPPSPHL